MTKRIPPFTDRIRMMLDVATGRAFRSNQSNRLDSKAKQFQLAWPAWREGIAQWSIVDFEAYLNEGFNLNALIYSTIMYKARAITQAPLRAYTGDLDNPKPLPDTDPLAILARRPNPHQSHIEFAQQSLVYLNIAGENFTVLARERAGALPIAMFSLRPDRVRIIPGDGGVFGYVYIPEGKSLDDGVPILPEDMIHVKLPNPGDPLEGMGHGLSPISPIAQSADVDNMVTEFLKIFFEHGAIPQGVLEFNVSIDESTAALIKERWHEQYGSYRNWSEVGVLDAGAKYSRAGLTFAEMGFDSIDNRNGSRIMAPFGVPAVLVGAMVGLENATYSNVQELRRMCWEDTLIPELLMFEVEYYHSVRDAQRNAWLMYDLSNVPALQRNILDLINGAKTLFDMGYPRDIASAAVGLEIETSEFGDVSFLPGNYLPTERLVNPPPAPTPPPISRVEVLPPGDDDEMPLLPSGKEGRIVRMPPFPDASTRLIKRRFRQDQKVYLWWKINNIAISWEDRYRDAAIDCFDDDLRALLAIVQRHKQRSMQQKVSIGWESVEQDWRAYVTGEGWDRWRETFQPLLRGTMEEQGRSWAAELGIRFDIRNLDAEEWFDDYVLQFAQPINETTLNDLHEIIGQALAERWSIPEMQSNLTDVFSQWMEGDLDGEDFDWFTQRLPPHRTELIARSETMRASNSGSHQLFETWGVRLKEWLHTQDGRVRPTHRTAGQTYSEGGTIGPIPISEPFMVGGHAMMHPLDPSAPIGEVANCRCTELPFIPDEESAAVPTSEWRGSPLVDVLPQARTTVAEQREKLLETQAKVDAIETQIVGIQDQTRALTNKITMLREQMSRDFRFTGNPTTDRNVIDQRNAYAKKHIEPLQDERQKLYQDSTKLRREQRDIAQRDFLDLFGAATGADVPYNNSSTFKPSDPRSLYIPQAFDWLRELLPSGVWDQSKPIRVKAYRGRAYSDEDAIYIDKSNDAGVIVHEAGHAFEWFDKHVHERAVEFLQYRAGAEKPQWLGGGYARAEIAYFDQFIKPYMGKVYEDNGKLWATEIISMGLDMMYRDPLRFANEDPEYFEFMILLISGAI